MTNETFPCIPATSTPRLTEAQRQTLRRRENRARQAEAAKRAGKATQLHGRTGGHAAAPATQNDSKNAPKGPQFPQLTRAARRALSRTTVSSTEIKVIRVAQISIEAERQRKLAARDAELRRRKLNRRLPKR